MGRRSHTLTVILCFVLIAILGVFMVFTRRDKQEKIRELQKTSEVIASSDEDSFTTDVAESTASTTAEEATSSVTAPAESTPATSEVESVAESMTESVPAAATALDGISLRGETFTTLPDAGASAYPTLLAAELKAIGVTKGTIKDYTVNQCGSMSHLKKAGVDDTTLQAFIAAHQASKQTATSTETKLRDFTAEELTRDDQNALPIICIGYYGGWGNNPDELVQQVQDLLKTYSQQDKYIVIGCYPAGYAGGEAYNAALSKAFGIHLIDASGNNWNKVDKASRQGIAKAVAAKIKELGYDADLNA
ncbi:MAG: hypothetical protein VZR02_01520 [Lachnospiraceae bacterium]|nr:hypothetical protein [Lachnospiraceae bacterium]